jgi:hypothetical protein
MTTTADSRARRMPAARAADRSPGTEPAPTPRGPAATPEPEPEPESTRLSEDELVRLRAKVDGGTPLDLETEAAALVAEMQAATAATRPAAAALTAAADAEAERLGRSMTYFEMEVLWEADPSLQAVKRLYDRQRARWRRANGILRESNLLLKGGEEVPVERRAPYRIDPSPPRAARRRRPPWRR